MQPELVRVQAVRGHEPHERTRTMAEQAFGRVEIEIDTECDLRCACCDRFVDVATAPPMTVGQMRRFAVESMDLEWRWERIRILGGEPTLHPEFREIMGLALAYREWNPEAKIVVITNGRGRLKGEFDWLAERRVAIQIEAKQPRIVPEYFHNMWQAPYETSRPDREAFGPCDIYGDGCGLGLNRHGYYCCGAGAGIARIAGLDIAVRTLADVTPERMRAQAEALCRLCGHAEGYRYVRDIGLGRTPFWEKAIRRAEAKAPELPLYGG